MTLLLFLWENPGHCVEKLKVVIGQDVNTIEDYVRTFHHIPDGVMAYTSLKDLEGLWSESDHGGGIQHADRLLHEYPHVFLQLGLHLVDILPEIPKGLYNDHLKQLSGWLKGLPVKVYLRIGYEFDGPHNHYDSKDYIAAYKYIVDTLRRDGVSTVEYVWHSYAGYVEGGDLMRWYPGDEYVDWVGISFFDAYSAAFRQKVADLAANLHKPLMIAESTPYKIGVNQGEKSWRVWFERYFDFIRKNNVKMFSYINWDWEQIPMFQNQGWGNGRLQDDPYIYKKWIEQLEKNGYIPSESVN